MSDNMRITRSRGGGRAIPRMSSRNRPPTQRGQSAPTTPRTPSPDRTRRSTSRNSVGTPSSRQIQLDDDEQTEREMEPDTPENVNQPGEGTTLSPVLGEQQREQEQLNE